MLSNLSVPVGLVKRSIGREPPRAQLTVGVVVGGVTSPLLVLQLPVAGAEAEAAHAATAVVRAAAVVGIRATAPQHIRDEAALLL